MLLLNVTLLREKNLSSSERQKKRFDMINYGFYESYIPILLRKQEVLFIVMSKCANASVKNALMLGRSLLLYHIHGKINAFSNLDLSRLSFSLILFENKSKSFFKARSNKRIFEYDFSRYNKALNKTFRQFKRISESLNKDYMSIYLFNNIIILGNFTPQLSLKSINNDDLFHIII